MDSKHIERDYSAHRKSVIRPYDEYVKLEIFSFDPQYTQTYLREDNTLKGLENTEEVSYRSWSCYKSQDKQNAMKFNITYDSVKDGNYRIDLLYEQNSKIHEKVGKKDTNTNKDLTGTITINGVELKPELLFDGENNIIKRISLFEHFEDVKQDITFTVPHNCYFYGVIIRKVLKFVGDNYYGNSIGSDDGNMILTTCSVTNSDMTKPKELTAEVFYDDDFECDASPSGFYIDYHDEMNFYVKNDENEIVQIFGGYVSSILPDSDRTKLTIHGADRLSDGTNKYVLDVISLGGGKTDQTDTDYDDTMKHNFDNYPSALKYLCDIHETTLKSNITKNYTVDGEKYAKGLVITYGKNKKIKKIPTTNGRQNPSKNYILIRNSPTAEKEQTWTLYDAKEHSKLPIDITNFPYMHITYGLGKKKTEIKTKTTEKVETSDVGVGGSQKFNKCGVSSDGKYLMAIGLPSASKDSHSGWTKTVFKRKCPHCGSTDLVWDIGYGEWGYAECRGANEGGGVEGHIFCRSCDSDYSCQGYEHYSWSSYALEKVSQTVSSSQAEANKLRGGSLSAVPSTSKEVSSDDILDAITKEAFKYQYRLGAGSSSYSSMKACGYGDCWSFSELIFDWFKKYGVSCAIKEYNSGYAYNHRSVIYKDANNKWVDFPYREKGWGSRYDNMLNNYPIGASFHGATIQEYKGHNIGSVKGVGSSTKTQTSNVTHTRGYDKDKPFQGYLKIVYSLEQSFKAKKYEVYVKFTLTPPTNLVSTSGLNLYWVNDTVKQTTLRIGTDSKDQHDGLVYFLRQAVHHDNDAQIYLQSIHMIAPQVKASKKDEGSKTDTDWYKLDDSNDDQSSCKIDLYQIAFNDDKGVESDDKATCGKTVNSVLQEIVQEAGYYVDMSYGLHRKDDQINFRVVNNTTEQFIATEGDNNNILAWNSISYSPIGSLYNLSRCVFKRDDGDYYYIDSHDAKSLMQYGEQCTLQSTSDPISVEQAYFNATESDKYNPSQTYTYTITVPNYPTLRIGDLVKVVANAKKLNNLIEVNSTKFTFEHDKMPRLRTEIGLGELAPDIQLKKNIRELRSKTKEEDTIFSSTATPISDEMYYTWDR